MGGNTRTLAEAHSPSGIARDITISYPDNPDADRIIANPTPTLPGKISIGSGVSPLLDMQQNFNGVSVGDHSILPSFQAGILINALKENKEQTSLVRPGLL